MYQYVVNGWGRTRVSQVFSCSMWRLTSNKLVVDQYGTIGFHYCSFTWVFCIPANLQFRKEHVITSQESTGSNKSCEIFRECGHWTFVIIHRWQGSSMCTNPHTLPVPEVSDFKHFILGFHGFIASVKYQSGQKTSLMVCSAIENAILLWSAHGIFVEFNHAFPHLMTHVIAEGMQDYRWMEWWIIERIDGFTPISSRE